MMPKVAFGKGVNLKGLMKGSCQNKRVQRIQKETTKIYHPYSYSQQVINIEGHHVGAKIIQSVKNLIDIDNIEQWARVWMWT